MNYSKSIGSLVDSGVKVYTTYGPPGTGKSTTMLNEIGDLVRSGVSPKNIVCVAYNRWINRDLISRAIDMGISDPKNFCTIHGFALSRLQKHRASSGEKLLRFMRPGHLYALQKRHPVFRSLSKPGGEDALSVINSLRETYFDRPDELSRIGDALCQSMDILGAYRDFKDELGILDYTDMLLQAYKLPPPDDYDHVFVDETQDLSDLQISLALQWSAKARSIHFYGDDDQQINAWRAGVSSESAFLLALHECSSVNKSVLGQSYRLPRAVHDHASTIISQVSNRVPKEFSPRPEDGFVRRVSAGSVVSACSDIIRSDPGSSIALLLRVNNLSKSYVPLFVSERLLFDNMCCLPPSDYTERPIQDEFLAISHARSLSNGDKVTSEQLKLLLEVGISPKAAKTIDKWPDQSLWSLGDLDRIYQTRFLVKRIKKDPFAAVLTMPPWRRYYIRQNYDTLMSFEDAWHTPVKIMTMHASKGLQFDYVFVDKDGFRKFDDGEFRVLYVAVTRAKKGLFLVNFD